MMLFAILYSNWAQIQLANHIANGNLINYYFLFTLQVSECLVTPHHIV